MSPQRHPDGSLRHLLSLEDLTRAELETLLERAQFYARRFVMAYPNEELPAARPLKTTPCYDAFEAAHTRFTQNWGLEVPLYFAPSADFIEEDTIGRSNAARRLPI